MFISEAGSHYIELWLTSEIHLLRLETYTTTPNLHFILWGVEGTGGVETSSGCACVYLELGTQTVRLSDKHFSQCRAIVLAAS